MATSAQTKPATPFSKLGGHETFQAITERFYDVMDSDPAYAELRAMHEPDLTRMRGALALFLAGWAGGPRDWFDQNPGRCMMSVHKPYTISSQVAEQWSEAMQRAIADVAPEEDQLAKAMGEALGELAKSMGQ
ncbi:MAG: group II truncated hemoglobin [Novosphingobium sp.]|nr:group II truncated hemoglobin [Novosphingobium sp.]